ncbi:MAG: nucleotide exchange factor GrpE, partial [Actinobacteria bacterium]|nr:nucleotide exchange factor GrpE [Actinomycetota bacterium]
EQLRLAAQVQAERLGEAEAIEEAARAFLGVGAGSDDDDSMLLQFSGGDEDEGIPFAGFRSTRHVQDERSRMSDEMDERTARLEGELAASRDLMAKAEQDVMNVRPDGETDRQRLWQADAEQARRQQMGFLGKLLEVLDTLQLSVTYGESSAVNVERLVEAVRLTCSLLQGALVGEGVTEVAAVGEMFNPALHEALESDVTTDSPDGQIVADLRRGYRYGDQLLRPSLVRVAIATTARERVQSANVAPAPTRAPDGLIVDATGGGDYTTIASAYANAKAGENIVVRPGTYREALVLDRDVEIVGKGDRALIVVEATDTDAVTVTADRVAVRNLTVR